MVEPELFLETKGKIFPDPNPGTPTVILFEYQLYFVPFTPPVNSIVSDFSFTQTLMSCTLLTLVPGVTNKSIALLILLF